MTWVAILAIVKALQWAPTWTFQRVESIRGANHVFFTVPLRDASTSAPQPLQPMSWKMMFLRETTILSSSATCFVDVPASVRSVQRQPGHSVGTRCSSGLFVSSLCVTPWWPTLLPGGLHAGCRACSASMALLLRYSAAHVPLRGGEWGLLWYLSLAASFLLSSPMDSLAASSRLIFSSRSAISAA